MSRRYSDVHARSLRDPDDYWGEVARQITWSRKWDRVLDTSRPPYYRWFTGGELNTCYNALDRHVESGAGDRVALIYDSPVTSTIRTFTYSELRMLVSRFAGALASMGVGRGDRVVIYMPMIPEAAIAMLACARLGAIHSVVFGGFAAPELAARIEDSKPKVIVSASCGIEVNRVVAYKPLLDEAIALSTHKPDACVVVQRPQLTAKLTAGRDHEWEATLAKAMPVGCTPVLATDPLYILYTSGTTGQPKGIVRDNGGHAVALCDSMKTIYGIGPEDVWWTASDVGWVVGHSYIVYAPLLAGCTSVLFEGKPVGTPDAGVYWRIIAQHNVRALFTAPTAFRAIRRDDPNGEFIRKQDLGRFRTLFLAGERCDPATLEWAQTMLRVPVIDHWWQTETGWTIVANSVDLVADDGKPFVVKPGSPTKPAPGWDVHALDAEGKDVRPGDIGTLACKLPLPPGTAPTLWNAEERFFKAYLEQFPGYYSTGDAGYVDGDGYVFVMTRVDDVINVAGHRLSTGAMEEVVASHPDVAECAVIGIADELKGQVPLGFVVLKAGVERAHDTIVGEIVHLVRERIGPVAAFKAAVVVKRLPKTRSGKILRATMQKIADEEPYKVPATIDDPVILDEIADALHAKV
ncbi:MAG: propionyl-CoA synthetase [Candidatus Eremiobacteraeota bacterium]|nr:propionyl-CoA synthetase [Candidatus Eremiobacteraeota bacterium]